MRDLVSVLALPFKAVSYLAGLLEGLGMAQSSKEVKKIGRAHGEGLLKEFKDVE